MDEMLRYVFGKLQYSEEAMKKFMKSLKKQNSFNRGTIIFMMLVTVRMAKKDMEIRDIQREIAGLKVRKEIREDI